MRSPPSLRSYSFLVFGFCLLFLIFGYRSLRRSGHSQSEEDDYFGEEGSAEAAPENLAKLLQTKCSEKLERIGEHSVCQAKTLLNKERNCLAFSIATSSDLKFEAQLGQQLDKCKVRVYDHEAKASDSDGKYKVVEKLEADTLTDKHLVKILSAEKKGKIHLLRLEAGAETAKLAQTKLLKERSVCQLLLTVTGLSESELGFFARKMHQTYGYGLYAVNVLAKAGGDDQDMEADEDGQDEEELEEAEEAEETDSGKKKTAAKEDDAEKKAGTKVAKSGKAASAKSRVYTLSFVSDSCKKGFRDV